MADRTLIQGDAELWRRTGHAVALRCPNAGTEPCDYPACRCHQPQPAECATELGADDDKRLPITGARPLVLYLIGALLALVGGAAVLL